MSHLDMSIRAATPHDAGALAPLINQAGEGLPMYLWRQLAGAGIDPWDHGRARVAGTGAGFSHKNAWVGTVHGQIAGCLLGYTQPETPDPVPEDIDPMFRPLLELEAEAPGTGYVNVLATVPNMQGQGVGSRLLEFAEERFRGPNGMSIIVSGGNPGARRLYERHGYRQAASRSMTKGGWQNPGTEWVLMVKPG